MEFILIGLSTFLTAVVVILIFRLFKAIKARNVLEERYKGISDRDAEIQKRETSISELSQKLVGLDGDYKKRSQDLNDEYSKYKTIYDALRRELALVEENLEIQSFGVYKPHFDFNTSEEYKEKLEHNYQKQKVLIKGDLAARCTREWVVQGSRRDGERMTREYTKLMLRAFNGECDASIGRIKWNNATIMEQRIQNAFQAINKMGTIYNIFITQDYLSIKLEELWLSQEWANKQQKEKEEQRRIQEQMREEEKVQREIEKATKDAEDEEKRYQKALDKARLELEKARGAELDELNSKIVGLEHQLKQAQEEKERAISRAQLTKSGHVYIISNIGSFGENVFKIGMTRRLEPLDRVKELGDASVPFGFDVHAMIYSENAPELEGKLHDFFEPKRVNLINERKEFFNVPIEELEEFAQGNGLSITITRLAEAREYRETLALKKQLEGHTAIIPEPTPFPDSLINAS